jgi:hypothetical protein
MIQNIFIKILFIIFIGTIIYIIYNFFNNQYLFDNKNCDIDNFDIDDLMIIKRTPEDSKLINSLIDKKKFIFSDKELKVLKNPQQIFNISNDKQNIENISNTVYLNCKNDFDSNLNINKEDNDDDNNNDNDLINVSDKEYNNIVNMLKNDIKQFIGPNCFNTGVLKKNIPLIKNYLKNYYRDLYGNKIEADLSNYFTAYYTLINENDDIGLPVNTLIGKSNFIIPDQYNHNSHFTNAYNIDWERIINPISYSQ